MRQKLTHTDTLQLQEVVDIGDLMLLPNESAYPVEETRALQIAGVLTVGEGLAHHAQMWDLFALRERYNHDRWHDRGREPAWVTGLPIAVRVHLRASYAATEEEVMSIVNGFPFTGILYSIRDDGLANAAEQTFNLRRLGRIRQLGFLQSPWIRHFERIRMPLSVTTRFLHCNDVFAIASLIGHNLGLSKHRLATLQVAALVHDVGTPAGGDSVKIVDLAAMDEDANFPSLLARYDWEPMRKRFGLRTDELVATVQNQGILGQALDFADKIAYVARDTHACMHHIEGGARGDEQLGLRSLLWHAQKHPYVCGIWDSITRYGDNIVFTDAGRLLAFLTMRVLLFRELYYHPFSRFGEFLMSRLLVKSLYLRGRLTRDMLLEMDDTQLLDFLANEYGVERYGITGVLDTCSSNLSACESFRDVGEAEAFARKLRAEGNPFTLIEDNSQLIKTGDRTLVRTRHGVMPLCDAYPNDVARLRESASLLPQVHVYYLRDDPSLPREVLAQLKDELSTL